LAGEDKNNAKTTAKLFIVLAGVAGLGEEPPVSAASLPLSRRRARNILCEGVCEGVIQIELKGSGGFWLRSAYVFAGAA
jgi:hypothetical protein